METTLSPLGRPRAFDTDQALDQAMHLFWRKGFLGTSLSDLTEAMGINRPSLYAAFGHKEALFRRAVERYFQGPAAYLQDALKEPTARAAVERLLQGVVELVTDPRLPQTVNFGLSVQAATGANRKELLRVVATALRA